jgi:hypothetical protein
MIARGRTMTSATTATSAFAKSTARAYAGTLRDRGDGAGWAGPPP